VSCQCEVRGNFCVTDDSAPRAPAWSISSRTTSSRIWSDYASPIVLTVSKVCDRGFSPAFGLDTHFRGGRRPVSLMAPAQPKSSAQSTTSSSSSQSGSLCTAPFIARSGASSAHASVTSPRRRSMAVSKCMARRVWKLQGRGRRRWTLRGTWWI
jgi:hypothetical protein